MTVLGLAACSDMNANPADSTIAVLPADFDARTYLAINPDMFEALIADSVKRANEKDLLPDSLSDDSAFLRDTVTARWIKNTFRISDTLLNLDTLLLFQKGAKILINTGASGWSYNFRHNSNDIATYQYILANADSVALAEYNYQYAGRYDGHPYRYCTASDAQTELRAGTQAVLVPAGAGKTIPDYSAHTYCYNETSKLIYLIQ